MTKMKIKFESLQNDLRNALDLRELLALWVLNSLISVVITLFFFTTPITLLLARFGHSFVFSQCIGGFIYLFSKGLQPERIKNNWKKLAALTGIFSIGGWCGLLLGWGINNLLFDFSIALADAKTFFIWTTFLALFFGAIGYSYFVLREKLQEAVAKLAEKEVNEQRLLQLKSKAELEALRTKVNPHFLFNTLNSIVSLIPVDPMKAEEMVQKLSHLFRYTLETGNHELMKLTDELDVVRQYLEIEKVRLGKRLKYHIKMEESLAGFWAPGLIIQPLVENSIKYAIAPSKTGGMIQVNCTRQNSYCQIEIRDNGKGFIPNRDKEGFGLSGIKERLSLYYGDDYRLNISSDNGVKILINLPLTSSSEKLNSTKEINK